MVSPLILKKPRRNSTSTASSSTFSSHSPSASSVDEQSTSIMNVSRGFSSNNLKVEEEMIKHRDSVVITNTCKLQLSSQKEEQHSPLTPENDADEEKCLHDDNLSYGSSFQKSIGSNESNQDWLSEASSKESDEEGYLSYGSDDDRPIRRGKKYATIGEQETDIELRNTISLESCDLNEIMTYNSCLAESTAKAMEMAVQSLKASNYDYDENMAQSVECTNECIFPKQEVECSGTLSPKLSNDFSAMISHSMSEESTAKKAEDAIFNLESSIDIKPHFPQNDQDEIMKHEYLAKLMEQAVQNLQSNDGFSEHKNEPTGISSLNLPLSNSSEIVPHNTVELTTDTTLPTPTFDTSIETHIPNNIDDVGTMTHDIYHNELIDGVGQIYESNNESPERKSAANDIPSPHNHLSIMKQPPPESYQTAGESTDGTFKLWDESLLYTEPSGENTLDYSALVIHPDGESEDFFDDDVTVIQSNVKRKLQDPMQCTKEGLQSFEDVYTECPSMYDNQDVEEAVILKIEQSSQKMEEEVGSFVEYARLAIETSQRLSIDEAETSSPDRWYAEVSSHIDGLYYHQPSTGAILREMPDDFVDTTSVRRAADETLQGREESNTQLGKENQLGEELKIDEVTPATQIRQTTCRRLKRRITVAQRLKAIFFLFAFAFLTIIMVRECYLIINRFIVRLNDRGVVHSELPYLGEDVCTIHN